MRHVTLGIALLAPLISAVADASDVISGGAMASARPGAIAHRGVALEAPENTLPAIAKAIELGCALAEIDLRYTADGEVVLVHDETVDRTTDGTGRVAEKTLAELRALDAGAQQGQAFRGTRIPTLREAVEGARGRIQLYLDLKEADPRPVVRLIEQLGARSMVFYRPYTYVALQQILAEAPSSRVLLDLGDWLQAPWLLERLRHHFPTGALSSDWRNWEPRAVAEARRLGIPTFVNVLGSSDTSENLRAAVALGFDYIQTDHPRQLLEILGDRGARDRVDPDDRTRPTGSVVDLGAPVGGSWCGDSSSP
jgi:glycerophosphoryl diester phosphodiesterase